MMNPWKEKRQAYVRGASRQRRQTTDADYDHSSADAE